jgi:hypothetical protein
VLTLLLLLRLPNLDLQNPTLRILLQQLQDRAEVLIRHDRVLGPHFQVVLLAAPVDLELLDLLLGLLRLVLAHELCAVGRRRQGGCDLLVQRFERGLGGRVEDDELVPARGRDCEEDGERHRGVVAGSKCCQWARCDVCTYTRCMYLLFVFGLGVLLERLLIRFNGASVRCVYTSRSLGLACPKLLPVRQLQVSRLRVLALRCYVISRDHRC